MGAIEMNCAGLPVVTLGKNGYPDTVENGVTGYLCHSYKEIADKIVFLLTHDEVNERLGIQAKEQVSRFSPKNIMPLWFNLFDCRMMWKRLSVCRSLPVKKKVS